VNTVDARGLFERFRGSVMYVEVAAADGERHIGSAFHVGDGTFVTAAHVVERNEIISLGTTETAYVPLSAEEAAGPEPPRTWLQGDGPPIPVHCLPPRSYSISAGPFLATDPRADLAVFRVDELDAVTPYFELGSHLDDWVGASDFVLSDVLVMGYPPIPLSTGPVLVANKASVIAQIVRYDNSQLNFVLSEMPRGGRSGGVVYSEWGFVLGVVTHSLLRDGHPQELGYLTTTSIEAVYVCLAEHGMLPACQAAMWDEGGGSPWSALGPAPPQS
jgi:S1-C subfamily serine protease